MSEIAFLGIGNMGSALVKGALHSKFLDVKNIVAFDKDDARLDSAVKELKIAKVSSNVRAVEGADYIFLCVKPQQMSELLLEIKTSVSPSQCLVSIAAGVRTSTIEKQLSQPIPLVRVMSNTPAMVGCGMAAVTKGRYATDKHIQFVVDFFGSVGKAAVLKEDIFDAVTAVSGSGPAYFFYLTEALEEAALKLGFNAQDAKIFSQQTCLGAAQMLLSGEEPKVLREKVTSPGGTTEAALKYLKERDWASVFVEAVHRAEERSKVLSQAV